MYQTTSSLNDRRLFHRPWDGNAEQLAHCGRDLQLGDGFSGVPGPRHAGPDEKERNLSHIGRDAAVHLVRAHAVVAGDEDVVTPSQPFRDESRQRNVLKNGVLGDRLSASLFMLWNSSESKSAACILSR